MTDRRLVPRHLCLQCLSGSVPTEIRDGASLLFLDLFMCFRIFESSFSTPAGRFWVISDCPRASLQIFFILCFVFQLILY